MFYPAGQSFRGAFYLAGQSLRLTSPIILTPLDIVKYCTKVFLDCYSLNPKSLTYSRYYEARGVTGASRIDRQYHWGEIIPTMAEYSPIAFSDHLTHTVKVKVPNPLARMFSPKTRPQFKIREEVARDTNFQEWVRESMQEWESIRHESSPGGN